MSGHYILMGVFFSLIPALTASGIAWLLTDVTTAIVLIGLLVFLFGLDVCFRGSNDGEY